MHILRERLSVCVCASFPSGSEGGMLGLIVLVPDYCYSFDCMHEHTRTCADPGVSYD